MNAIVVCFPSGPLPSLGATDRPPGALSVAVETVGPGDPQVLPRRSCAMTSRGASLGSGAGTKKRRGTIVGRQRASWDLTRQSDSDRAVFLIAGPSRKP